MLRYGAPATAHRSAAGEAHRILVGLLERTATAGRLRLPPPAAANMIHAAGAGVTLQLIATAPADRDSDLSARTRETILAAITTDAEPADPSPVPLNRH